MGGRFPLIEEGVGAHSNSLPSPHSVHHAWHSLEWAPTPSSISGNLPPIYDLIQTKYFFTGAGTMLELEPGAGRSGDVLERLERSPPFISVSLHYITPPNLPQLLRASIQTLPPIPTQ